MKHNPIKISLLLTLIIISAFNADITAQKKINNPTIYTIIKDTALWEMVYIHTTFDPRKDRSESKFEILINGPTYISYGSYGRFQLDSIGRADPDRFTNMTREEYSALRRSLEIEMESTLVNKKEGSLEYLGRIFINSYRYEEPIPQFDWNLEDETMEVMGYECRKATTTWRGREWTAWYSDIPLSAGPWKFNGLPGLILRLEDSKNEHFFEAVKSMNEQFPFGYKKALYCKTTRKKYNDELTDYKRNAGKMFMDSGMVTISDSNRESNFRKTGLFHNPIELE